MHQHLGLLCPVVAAVQDALAVVADEELLEVVVTGVVPRPQVEPDRRHVRVGSGLLELVLGILGMYMLGLVNFVF